VWDAHAHTNPARRKSLKRRRGRLQRLRRGRKGDEEGIPLRIDLDATVNAKSLTQNAAMLRECPRILTGAQLVQQLCRILDVREQKGDGSGG
jgi:hypothetical protein